MYVYMYIDVWWWFAASEAGEEEEGEEGEESEAAARKKKPWGDTAHFCPVALREQNMLWPGSEEYALRYGAGQSNALLVNAV